MIPWINVARDQPKTKATLTNKMGKDLVVGAENVAKKQKIKTKN